MFAHLIGTLALLSESEQNRVQGFVINRFRGDIELLNPGLEWLAQHTGKPVLGTLPYLHGLHLESEDSLALEQHGNTGDKTLKVIIPALPRISNHTDFDPLRLHPQVDLQYIGPGQDIPAADLIILPGSKSVRADLAWLRTQGWETVIQRHLRYGGKVLGICGGFQMLGEWIHDPLGIEGLVGSSPGLGLLALSTQLAADKTLCNVSGRLALDDSSVTGYEIHAGQSSGAALERPVVYLEKSEDGAISEDGQVMGTYLHGLFESAEACASMLSWAGLEAVEEIDYYALREAGIDRLADAIEQHIDLSVLLDSQST